MSIGSSNKLKMSEKERGMTRIGCTTSYRIKFVNGIWEMSVFKEEHKHSLIIIHPRGEIYSPKTEYQWNKHKLFEI